MRVPRVALEVPGPIHGLVILPPEESYHLVRVLRRRVGDPVTLVTRRSGSFAAEIASVEETAPGPRATVRVLGADRAEVSALVAWSVAVAPVKGEGFDAAVRVAAELGLGRLLPVLTERTVVRPDPASGRIARWRRIAREAAKQCGREVPLEIPDPVGLPSFLGTWREGTRDERTSAGGGGSEAPTGFILVPGAPFPQGLQGLRSGEGEGTLPPAVFLIGPEGGFAPSEAERAREAGFEPAGFPVPTLRTPTAVELVAALGLLCTAWLWDRPQGR